MALSILAACAMFGSPPTWATGDNGIVTANQATAIAPTAQNGIDNVANGAVMMALSPVLSAGKQEAINYKAMNATMTTTTNTVSPAPAPEVAFNVICPQDAIAAFSPTNTGKLAVKEVAYDVIKPSQSAAANTGSSAKTSYITMV